MRTVLKLSVSTALLLDIANVADILKEQLFMIQRQTPTNFVVQTNQKKTMKI